MYETECLGHYLSFLERRVKMTISNIITKREARPTTVDMVAVNITLGTVSVTAVSSVTQICTSTKEDSRVNNGLAIKLINTC